METRCAYAGTIDRRTTREIFTITIQFTIWSVFKEWAWPIALGTTPAILTVALARLWMTEVRIDSIAITSVVTIIAVFIENTNAFAAVIAAPTGRTLTSACRLVTNCVILTLAFLRAIHAVSVEWTLFIAELTQIARRAFAFARYVMTGPTFEALALFFTLLAKEANRTLIGANIARPTLGAQAVATLRITFTAILTTTILFALHAMFAVGA